MSDSSIDDAQASTSSASAGRTADMEHALAEATAEVVRLRRALREVLDNANDIIYTHDLTGAFQSMNARGEQILGYAPAEIVEMNIADILPEAELTVARDTIRTVPCCIRRRPASACRAFRPRSGWAIRCST